MALYVYPLDNWQLDGAKYTGRRLRQMIGGLITGHTAGRPLGARSGVMAGTPSNTVGVSGTTWSLMPHAGVLDVKTAAIAGPYLYSSDVAMSGTIPAANASQDRVDLVCVQVTDPTEADGSQVPNIAVQYVTGTPGAGTPAVPAGALALAQINVPRQNGGSPTSTWIAPYTVANGGILPIAGTSNYPLNPYAGQYVHVATLGQLHVWDGGKWGPPANPRQRFQYRQGTTQTLVGNSTYEVVTGMTVRQGADTLPGFNQSTGIYTVQPGYAGAHTLAGLVSFIPNDATLIAAAIDVNGAQVIKQRPNGGPSVWDAFTSIVLPELEVTLNVGDTVRLSAYANKPGTQTRSNDVTYAPTLRVERLG